MSVWRREGCRIAASPDLSALFPASANLYATMANSINERGQISGMATVLTGPNAQAKAQARRLQMSHGRFQKSLCPRMLANSFCGDPDSADSSDKGYFRSFGTLRSSHMLREGARPEVVRDQHGARGYRVIQTFTARAGGKIESMRSLKLSKP